MKNRKHAFVKTSVAMAVAAVLTPTGAAPVAWLLGADGYWDVAGNWTPAAPANGDDVVINVAGLRTVTFRTGTLTLGSLAVTNNVLSVTGGSLGVSGGYLNTGTGSTLISGGTLTLNGASSLGAMTMSGGTLAGTGAVTVGGAATWTGGTMSGTGSTSFNGALALSGNGDRSIVSRTVNFAGTTTWDNSPGYGGSVVGRILTGSAATLNNTGTWLDKNSASPSSIYNANGGAASTFNNSGSYIKSGTAESDIALAFNNTSTGKVSVGAGVLGLGGGGSSTGAIDVAAGAVLSFYGGTFALSNLAPLTGTGQMLVSGATVNTVGSNGFGGQLAITSGTFSAGGPFAANTFNMSGGTLAGTDVVTIGGAATWTGGTMSGTGSTSFNGALALSGNGDRSIVSRTVNFAGTTTWDNSPGYGGSVVGRILTGSAATLNNTGTWLDKNSASPSSIYNANGGAASTFNNSGSYIKSGTAESDIALAFNNTSTGKVSVGAGVLGLGGGGSSTGAIDVAAGAVLSFYGGTFALSNLAPLTGTGQMLVSGATVNTVGSNGFGGQLAITSGTFSAGGPFAANTFNMSGGTLAGTDVVTIGGAATWTGGTMSGTGSTSFNGALALSGNGDRSIVSRTVNFAGTTTWDNSPGYGGSVVGRILTGSAATLNNTGTWLDKNSASPSSIYNANGGAASTFNNSGSYIKSGTAESDIALAFNNTSTGKVSVGAGVLGLGGGGSSTGAIDVAAGAVLSFYGGTFALSNLAPLTGTGQMLVSGATVNTVGSNGFGGQLAITSGTFSAGGPFAANTFNMSGGTLAGTDVVTIGGAATWTGGTMSGTGSTSFNGALALSGNGDRSIVSRTVNFAGTTTWDNSPGYGGSVVGRILTGSAATLNNTGTWLDKNSASPSSIYNANGGAASTFNNSGSYIKSGTAESDIALAFNNTSTGKVSVGAGVLGLGGGGSSTGAIDVAAGAVLSFYGGTFALSNLAPLTGTGQMLVSGATVNTVGSNGFGGQLAITSGTFSAGGPFAANTFNMSGGTLAGTDVVTIGGAATWTGGTMSGTGSTSFNGALALSGNGDRSIVSRTVNFAGTTTWDNSPGYGGSVVGRILTGSAATLNNTGTWLDKNSASPSSIYNANGGAASTFNNSGSYIKSGTAESDIALAFNNTSTGKVSVGAGVLGLGGGGSSTGAIDVAAGAVLSFYGGTFALSNLAPLTGTGQMLVSGATVNTVGSNGFGGQLAITSGTFSAGGPFAANTFNMSGGTLAGTDVVTIGGAATWTGGTMSGTGSTSFNGALALSGNGDRSIVSRTVNFAGTTTWDNSPGYGGSVVGRILTGSAATLNNTGTWLDKNSASPSSIYNANGGAASTFNNSGSYIKSGTADTTLGIATANTGLIDVQAGHLYITDSGGLQGNGTLRIGPAGAATVSYGNDTVGTLDHQGASGSLDIGTKNVTVYRDYNNASFGTGNSFVPHANVTGTGKINGYNALQTITGATVTNGGLANATLTLTNVHLGTNSYTYEIANTGTGASIRGAIQTSVNGGHLTDSRLSGNGVTASNFGAIAAGASSSDYIVTFNVASAGNLAPLDNQVIHFASNFDNVAGQNLSIVLGSGASGFRLAAPSVAAPVDFGAIRVGSSATQTVALTNTAPNDGFSERLNASIASSGTPATASGSFTLLNPQATNSSALQVGLDTSSAGAKSGSAVITLVSDGSGTSGLGQTALLPQTVSVTGRVYNVAVGSVSPAQVVFANQHVGDAASRTLTVGNVATAGNFSEALNAGFSGQTGNATRNAGNITNLAAGVTNISALAVGLDTSAAGARSGTVTVAFQSDGTGSNGNSGLAAIAAGSQVVSVSGNVYRYASAQTIAPVDFGNLHVGDIATQVLTIRNIAANDGYSEALNASFGGTTDTRITTSGSITRLAAGASDSANLIVGLNTAAAGTVNGTATVTFASDGTGTSNLGVTALPSQQVGVAGVIGTTGSVYRLASPSAATPNPVDFGNVRIGTAATQALTLSNTAPNDGFSEKLDASIASSSAGVSASGSFSLLAAQSTNSSGLVVGLDTSSAGAKSGTASITLASDGTGTSGLGITQLGSQTVAVTGNVYRLASPIVSPSSIALAARVGDAAPRTALGVTNSSPDAFTERLNASFGPVATGFGGSGTVTGLAAGATSAALSVSMNTATAGSFGGSATVKLASTGAGTTGAADLVLADQSIALSGHVYTPAVAQVATTTVDFGIVHKGDSVAARTIGVTNAAAATALNDTLQGSIGGAPAPFSASGTVVGLGAQRTDATSFSVGLSTGAAGVFSGSATASFASHDGDLADLALGTSTIALKAQVNNYADAAFVGSGAGQLSSSGHTYVLDFGNVALGATVQMEQLAVLNSAVGAADVLSGSFDLTAVGAGFQLTGFNAFGGLVAGSSFGGLSIAFLDGVQGDFSGSLVLHGVGSNASGYIGSLDDTTLILRGNAVAAVPEPGSYVLIFGGLLLVVGVRRPVRRRPADTFAPTPTSI